MVTTPAFFGYKGAAAMRQAFCPAFSSRYNYNAAFIYTILLTDLLCSSKRGSVNLFLNSKFWWACRIAATTL